MNLVKKQAAVLVNSQTFIRYYDQQYLTVAIDKVAKSNAEMEIEHSKYVKLLDNSSFKLNEKSLRMYTKHIKYYTGESFEYDK